MTRTDDIDGGQIGIDELQTAASSILVPLKVRTADKKAFRARIDSGSAGDTVVARIRGHAHVVSRDPRTTTAADRDLLKVTLHRSGSAHVTQDGRHSRVRPGDLLVLDTLNSYELKLETACDVVVLGLPRAKLGTHAKVITDRTAMSVAGDTGTRAVIASCLSGIGDQVTELASGTGPYLEDALASLLIAAFSEITPERADVAAGLFERIVAYTLANLADPNLSVSSVARRHGISPNHLHRLFRRHDRTFAAWVRHERLKRIRRDLLAPTLAHCTMGAIAAAWGIRDSRHLSRAFKTEFGRHDFDTSPRPRTAGTAG